MLGSSNIVSDITAVDMKMILTLLARDEAVSSSNVEIGSERSQTSGGKVSIEPSFV